MNEHERVLAVLNRQPVDRVPWVARLDLWYNARLATDTMPERFQGWSLWDIDRALGIGIRTLRSVVDLQTDGFETRVCQAGDETLTEYVTPVGTVSTRTVYNDLMRRSGVTTGYRSEHLIKRPEDYDVVEYIYEHTRPAPSYDAFVQAAAEIGGDGFVLGGPIECPYQRWLIQLTGYETGFAHLSEHTERVERFLRFLTDWTRLSCRILLDSPAEIILCGDNLDGTITPPRLFGKYCVPFYQEFSLALHQRGKWLASHMDGESAPLLPVFAQSGVDIAECFTPAPMTRATVAAAQHLWGDRVIIWGGIPSIVLTPSVPEDDFQAFLDNLFERDVPAGNLILGVGDNVVADASLERVIRISERVRGRA